MACHDCDLIHRIPLLKEGQRAVCSRCGAVLVENKTNSVERSLALTMAGIILFIIANCHPFLSLKLQGQVRQTTLTTGVAALFEQDMWLLAILVLLTTIAIPLAELLGLAYVLLPIRFDRVGAHLPRVFRFVNGIKAWGMMEVFMLGILVTIVKLAQMAEIIPGVSLYAFLALIFVLAAVSANLDGHLIWEKWERRR
jgi:paraquat-inducible protein A